MIRQLVDVNVLLALIWPRHQGHAAAHHWFEKSGSHAWATSPLTQLGVLRLLTNPVVTQGAVSATAALAALNEATHHQGHEFWPINRELAVGLNSVAGRLQGNRQWTGAVLLSQAIERHGGLVTFDSGVRELADREFRSRVTILRHA